MTFIERCKEYHERAVRQFLRLAAHFEAERDFESADYAQRIAADHLSRALRLGEAS